MATFACETCGLELSSKHALEAHVNRKYKCVPQGQVQYECRTCDKQFTKEESSRSAPSDRQASSGRGKLPRLLKGLAPPHSS